MAVKPIYGFVGIQKTGGTATALGTTQRNILCMEASPFNPDNNSYQSVIDASGYPAVDTPGKLTPTARLVSCYKPYNGTNGWCDAQLLNSLIISVGTDTSVTPNINKQTDKFALAFKDDRAVGSGGLRVWDWSRCNRITFSQEATGGPVMVTMDFLSRWGDAQEAPSNAVYSTTLPDGEVVGTAPTWTTPSGPDSGRLTNVGNVSFGGTLDKVRSWTLTFVRAQVPEFYVDKTYYAKDISSIGFSGILDVVQSADAGTVIESTGSPTLDIATDATATTGGGIHFALKVKRDNRSYSLTPALGTAVRTYSLYDFSSGGNPATCTAL